MVFKVKINNFKHYVCEKCGSYFASLSDLIAHLEVCDEFEKQNRKEKKKGEYRWWKF